MNIPIIPQKRNLALACIFVVALLMRFWNIGAADVTTDEASYGFRAIGLIDFDASKDQPTPWEWSDPPPPLLRLSFHDHPPLFFWIQHFSLKIFGENTFALRFPSAIFGAASILLLYGIGKKMFSDERWGLAAALFSAVNIYLVWISRLGLQESTALFFALLSFYFFLLSHNSNKFYLLLGISLGLAFLAKYTSFFLLPLFLSFLAIKKREDLKSPFFWGGMLLSLLLFSPVILYNIYLYKNFGHFDFQFSYIFGQDVSLWKVQPGKTEFKNIQEKFFFFFTNLFRGLSSGASILSALALFSGIWKFFKKKNQNIFLILLALGWLFFEYLLIGPSQRFLSLSLPFLLLLITDFFKEASKKIQKKIFLLLAALFIFSEGVFTYNSALNFSPQSYFSQDIHSHFSRTGYNELDGWMNKLTRGKRPKFSFPLTYQFLKNLAQKTLENDMKLKKTEAAYLFIYDNNLNEQAALWTQHRFSIYSGWPALSASAYFENIKKEGMDSYKKLGFEKIFLIVKNKNVLGKKFSQDTRDAQMLLNFLNKSESEPSVTIKNWKQETAFDVYEL